jgi:hypothetical protein
MHFLYSAALLAGLSLASPPDLHGLHVGDDQAKFKTLPGKPTGPQRIGAFFARKWRFSNGDELSATTSKSGKIVYAELDWNGDAAGAATGLGGLVFGRTTLAEIRPACAQEVGFDQRTPVQKSDDGVVWMISCSVGSVVLTTITEVTVAEYKKAHPDNQHLEQYAKLVAVSISDPSYAQTIWGKIINVRHDKTGK